MVKEHRIMTLSCAAFLFLILHRIDATTGADPAETVIVGVYKLERFDDVVSPIDAKTACEERHSRLVEIKDEEISDGVRDLLSNVIGTHVSLTTFWIGLKYVPSKGRWEWNDGDVLDGFQEWDSGQPDNFDPIPSCPFVRSTNNLWSDWACDGGDRRYICQLNLHSVVFFNNSELVFYGYNTDGSIFRKNSTEASLICKARGSKLVDVKSAELETTINEELDKRGPMVSHYIGGKFDSEGTWVWGDSSIIGGYTNWNRSVIPNDTSRSCLVKNNVARNGKWISIDCSTEHPFICQREIINFLGIEDRIIVRIGLNVTLTVRINRYNESISVELYKVAESNILIHKKEGIGKTTVTLAFGPSDSSTSGKYILSAYSKSKRLNVNRTFDVVTFGPPIIISAITEPCSDVGAVNITWKPNKQFISVRHKLEVTPLSSGGESPWIREITPTIWGNQYSIVTNVPSNVQYKITISVCPDDCVEQLNDSITFMAEARLAASMNLHRSKDICVFKTALENSTNFQIMIRSTLRYSRLSENMQIEWKKFNLSSLNNAFYLPVTPNRNYIANISLANCAEIGPTCIVDGSCITRRKAPNVIQAPVLSSTLSDSIQQFKVFLPDEENGPISCLFIISHIGTLVNQEEDISIEDLQKLFGSNPVENEAYIALAITRSEILGSLFVALLGDDHNTSCRIESLGLKTTQNQNDVNAYEEYRARNWPLKMGTTYSIYVITSTPTDSGVLLKRSSPIMFEINNDSQGNNSQTLSIVLPSVLIIIAILIVTGLIYVFKRKQSGNLPLNRQDNLSALNVRLADVAEDPTYEIPKLCNKITEEKRNNTEELNPYSTIQQQLYANMPAQSNPV